LSLSDEVEIGVEPTGPFQVVDAELLVVGLAQPVLQLFETVLFFLEQTNVELAQLLFKIKLQVALEEQVHVVSGHLLENVAPFKEEEHFSTIESVVLVNIVDVVGELAGIFIVGNFLLEHLCFTAFGETAATTLLNDCLLTGPV